MAGHAVSIVEQVSPHSSWHATQLANAASSKQLGSRVRSSLHVALASSVSKPLLQAATKSEARTVRTVAKSKRIMGAGIAWCVPGDKP